MATAIKIENLSKQYRLGLVSTRTLSHDMNRWWQINIRGKDDPYLKIGETNDRAVKGKSEYVWALKDINLEVQEGEVLGIIGKNGAGKSTLLKILSKVTAPTTGIVKARGRIASLLEVGTGFHPEMTGRENIYMNGSIMGMTKAEITRKFDEIVNFSGVEKYIDTPVKRYSSGMTVRLGFAIAAHLEPEILVVDEVLAVGDAAFQKKAIGKMQDVSRTDGRTVLFVSHNMAAIENLCGNAVLLDRGVMRFAGTQTATISEYLRSFSANQASLKDRADHKGSGEVKVVGIELRDVEGHAIDNVTCGQDFDVVFHFNTLLGFRSNHLVASLSVKTQWDVPVFLHHNRMTGTEFTELPSQGAFVCRICKTPLAPSTYKIGYSILNGNDYLDSIDDAIELNIIAGDFFGSSEVPPSSHGFCLVEGHWNLE